MVSSLYKEDIYDALGIEYKLRDTPHPSQESIQIACKILNAAVRD